MASWNSTLKKCGKNLFNVEIRWNDGQGSYVKKFNNGIPTFVYSRSFYEDSLFFLQMSGKSKVVPHSVFLDLGSNGGKIKLLNSSTQYAKLFVEHWSIAGIKGLSISENSGIKEKKPDKSVIRFVRLYFEEVARSLCESKTSSSVAATKEYNANLRIELESSKKYANNKTMTKKTKQTKASLTNTTPQLRAGVCRNKKPLHQQKIKNFGHNIVSIDSYIKSLSVSSDFEYQPKGTLVPREDGHYEVKMQESNIDIKKLPIGIVSLPFKTKAAANKALDIISNIGGNMLDVSPFTLYLCSPAVMEKSGPTRTFHKLITGSGELIELLLEDWGGTPLGYALYKTINKDLGKFVDDNDNRGVVSQYLDMIKKQGTEFNVSQAIA